MTKELDFKFPLGHTVKQVISVNWFGENGMKRYLEQALDIEGLDLMANNDTEYSADATDVEDFSHEEAEEIVAKVKKFAGVDDWQLESLIQAVVLMKLLPVGDYLIYYSY